MPKVMIIATLCILMLGGCGYKISGYNSKKPIRFYIERVQNDTIDTQYGNVVQDTIDRYFIMYGEMASYDRATYFLTCRLLSVRANADIVSATDEAVSSTLNMELQMVVQDVNGTEVFSAVYKPTASFSVGSTVSVSIMNRTASIKTATEDALDNFRNTFSSKSR